MTDAERLAALEKHALKQVRLGPSNPTPNSFASIANIRVHHTPVTEKAVSSAWAWIAGGPIGGLIQLKRFLRVTTATNNNFTQLADTIDFPVTVPPLSKILVDTGWFPDVDEYLGGHFPANSVAIGGGDYLGWFSGSGPNNRNFSDPAPTMSSGIQIQFFFGANMDEEVARIAAELEEQKATTRMAIAPITIWPAYGQSRSIGSKGQPAISVSQPYENLTFLGGVKSTSTAHLASSRPLYEDNLGENADPNDPGLGETMLSSGANYAFELAAKQRGVTKAQYRIFRFTAGHGGASIAALGPGSAYFERLLSQVRAAVAIANTMGLRCVVSAIDFIQGETNANDSFQSYYDALIFIHAALDSAIRKITGQEEPVHMLLDQLGNQGAGMAGEAFLAQLEASNNSPLVHCVNPNYFIGRDQDGTHMENWQYDWAGKYLGRAHEELAQGLKPRNLQPISAVIDDGDVYVRFQVPQPPLVIDISTLPYATANGLRITDSSGDVAATDQELMPDGVTLKIVPGRSLSSDPKFRCGTDYLPPAMGTMNNAAITNFRDSTPDTAMVGGIMRPLWHWSMARRLEIVSLGNAY